MVNRSKRYKYKIDAVNRSVDTSGSSAWQHLSEGDPVLVDKVSRVINRLAADTASSSVGCGGKKVMTAIRRLISDCAAYHSNNNNFQTKPTIEAN